MKKQLKRNARAAAKSIWMPAMMIAALLLFTSAVSGLNHEHAKEDIRQLEDALRRSCVACYAIEGRYPPSVDYLKAHYGLQVDRSRYTVYYQIFAENLMPDIAVFEKKS